jgi:hypothetical protein
MKYEIDHFEFDKDESKNNLIKLHCIIEQYNLVSECEDITFYGSRGNYTLTPNYIFQQNDYSPMIYAIHGACGMINEIECSDQLPDLIEGQYLIHKMRTK